MKFIIFRPVLFAVCLACLALISACGSVAKPIAVGILSAEASGKNSQPVLSLAAEQNLGYQSAEAKAGTNLAVTHALENNSQSEIQVTVRNLVEKQAMMALVGSTSNENSTRLASLSNFFNVPVIIPSGVGDAILPSNNLWGFRLSAPGSTHAQYFFGSLVTHLAVQAFSGTADLAAPQLKIAILYEQNTFGESAAVAAARAAMQQEMKIGYYDNFDPSSLDLTRLKEQAAQINLQGIQLVYLISSDPTAAIAVLQALREKIPVEKMPVILGQSGAFASKQLLDSAEAQGIYVLRQKIVTEKCPPEITTLTEAQSYAAIVLLDSAVKQAGKQAGNTQSSMTALQKREDLRDVLKIFNDDLPCLGRVSFDISGQNKDLQFELLQVTKNGLVITDTDAFLTILKQVYDRSPFN